MNKTRVFVFSVYVLLGTLALIGAAIGLIALISGSIGLGIICLVFAAVFFLMSLSVGKSYRQLTQ